MPISGAQKTKQVFLKGTLILTLSTILVKIAGFVFTFYMGNTLGEQGGAYFSSAHEIFINALAISTAGLPVALSKLVAERVVMGKFDEAKAIRRLATKIFLMLGVIASILLFIIAKPLATNAIKMPQVYISIYAIAPALVILGLVSSYRGYYNGLHNMIPTGVSQVVEAVTKLFFGIGFAYFTNFTLINEFKDKGTVFGQIIDVSRAASATEVDKLMMDAIYPFTAASVMLGITISVFCGLIFLMIYSRLKGDPLKNKIGDRKVASQKSLFRTILRVALPIAISSIVVNIASTIDVYTIAPRLGIAIEKAPELMQARYEALLPGVQINLADLPKKLYSTYNFMALTIFGLIPTFTTAFSTSSLPIISEAWVKKDRMVLKSQINLSLRLTSLIAMPSAFYLILNGENVVRFAYGSGALAENLPIGGELLSFVSIGLLMVALASPVNAILQGMGKMRFTILTVFIGTALKFLSNFFLIGNPNFGPIVIPLGTIACYTVITLAGMLGIVHWAKIKIDFSLVFIKPMISGLICGISGMISFYVVQKFASFRLSLMLSILIGGVIYIISLLILRGISKEDVLILPKGEKLLKRLEK